MNDGLTINMVWHRMLYSCTCMAAVGIKGLTQYTAMLGGWSLWSVCGLSLLN